MIYVTGDIHGTMSVNKRLNRKNFSEQKFLTKDDYVIIAGDVRCDIHTDPDEMHSYFEEIEQKLDYKQWYFGHFHHDFELPNKMRLLYTDMIRIY